MTLKLSVAAILTAALALAQQTGITGRVTDPSKAVVGNVVVILTSDDGSKIETATNSQGIYQFPALRAALCSQNQTPSNRRNPAALS